MAKSLYSLKKEVMIEEVLGIRREAENEYFIFSPFRAERTPSFKINPKLNTWYDFGIGKGGSVLDLIMELHGVDTGEAVRMLRSGDFPKIEIVAGEKKEVNNTHVKVHRIKKFGENKAIERFVCGERKIARSVASKWVYEVYYFVDEKHRFGAGFRNDEGGYEIRNEYFKGTIGTKATTTISRGATQVALFEGFLDFLSALTYFEKIEPSADIVVLNSITMLDRVLGDARLEGYEKINVFFDNDEAGKRALTEIKKAYGEKVKDYSHIYDGFKDFNEMLCVRD